MCRQHLTLQWPDRQLLQPDPNLTEPPEMILPELPSTRSRKRPRETVVDDIKLGTGRFTAATGHRIRMKGREGALQSGSYALEYFSGTYGTRIQAIGIVLRDLIVFFWYYDAAGIL